VTARQREAEDLFDQGMSIAEVARRLGLSYMAAYYRLHPAKRREYMARRRDRQRPERRRLRCSSCGELGHNRRGCESNA